MSKTDATRPWRVRNADRLEGPYRWAWPLKDGRVEWYVLPVRCQRGKCSCRPKYLPIRNRHEPGSERCRSSARQRLRVSGMDGERPER